LSPVRVVTVQLSDSTARATGLVKFKLGNRATYAMVSDSSYSTLAITHTRAIKYQAINCLMFCMIRDKTG